MGLSGRQQVDAGQQLLDFLANSFQSAQYTAKSVLAGLIFSIGGSIILFIVFCFIRPKSNVVYAPRTYLSEGSNPTPVGKHPLSWMKTVYRTKTLELEHYIGIDASLYIQFMTMLRNIFLIFSILGCLIMIPVNVAFNMKSEYASQVSKSDAFILMTPTLIYGAPLYAQVVLTWIFDGIIMLFLWRNYEKIISLRRNKFMTEEYQNALFMRTLMVTEISKSRMSNSKLAEYMTTISTREIQNASVGRNAKSLSKLIEKHKQTVLKLESVLSKYLKNPDKLPPQRPVMKPFKGDTDRSRKVDAIEYLSQRMETLEYRIKAVRASIDSENVLPYGFVSYGSVEDCHTAAKEIGTRRKGHLRAVLATRPSDIIWENIVLSRAKRRNKQFWGNLIFVALMVLWIAPNAFMGVFLSNLNRIGALWPTFDGFMYNYPVIFSILQGVLSPVVTGLIFLILPMILRRMIHWQGKVTRHEREINTTKKLYSFFLFNNLFVFTVFGLVWNVISKTIQMVHNGEAESFQHVLDELQIGQRLSTSILGVSSFWVMFIFRVNFTAVLDLLQVFSLTWRSFRRHFTSPTPRQLMLWSGPQHFNFAAYYNWQLFYATIGLAFSMIQPLILPVLAFYFLFDVIFKKYQLMYIYVTKAETDGLYWPFLFNAMLFATFFGNMALLAVVWVQGGIRIAACLIPLVPIIIIYKIVSNKFHHDRFYYFIPTDNEQKEMDTLRTRTDLSDMSATALERRYMNPAINEKLIKPMVNASAQAILPHIFRPDNINAEEYDPSTAFLGMDGEDYYNMRDYDTQRNINGVNDTQTEPNILNRLEIINESDLNYETYQELERRRLASAATPNPYFPNTVSNLAPERPENAYSRTEYNPYQVQQTEEYSLHQEYNSPYQTNRGFDNESVTSFNANTLNQQHSAFDSDTPPNYSSYEPHNSSFLQPPNYLAPVDSYSSGGISQGIYPTDTSYHGYYEYEDDQRHLLGNNGNNNGGR